MHSSRVDGDLYSQTLVQACNAEQASLHTQELQQRCAELEAAAEAADAAHAAAEARREEKVASLRTRCEAIAARILELEAALEKTTADRSTDVVRPVVPCP